MNKGQAWPSRPGGMKRAFRQHHESFSARDLTLICCVPCPADVEVCAGHSRLEGWRTQAGFVAAGLRYRYQPESNGLPQVLRLQRRRILPAISMPLSDGDVDALGRFRPPRGESAYRCLSNEARIPLCRFGGFFQAAGCGNGQARKLLKKAAKIRWKRLKNNGKYHNIYF